MPLQWSRYTALLFAVALGIGEAVLTSGWAFTAGVFYMALFISLDPGVAKYDIGASGAILIAIGLMLIIAALGVVTSFLALRRSKP